MSRNFIIATLASMLFAGASIAGQSNELLVQDVTSAKGNSRAFSLDYVSDGSAVALQIRVKVNGASRGGLDLSKCLADLPKSHEGSCKLTDKGEILVLVFSGVNAALPAGLVSIGRIGALGKSMGSLEVTELLVSDKDANAINASSSIQ